MSEPMDFRDQAVQLVKDNGYRDLCEVGVWKGELSRMLAPYARTLVLVDPWSALWNNFGEPGNEYTCTMGEQGGSYNTSFNQGPLNAMYQEVCERFPNALVLRMPSVLAAQHVPDKSLDFVFVDAVHTFNHVRVDSYSWWPKLRTGGMLAGDDYVGCVKEAVDLVFSGVSNANNVWWVKKK